MFRKRFFGNFSAGAILAGFYKTQLELAQSHFYRIEFRLENPTLNTLWVRGRKNKNVSKKYF